MHLPRANVCLCCGSEEPLNYGDFALTRAALSKCTGLRDLNRTEKQVERSNHLLLAYSGRPVRNPASPFVQVHRKHKKYQEAQRTLAVPHHGCQLLHACTPGCGWECCMTRMLCA